MVESFNAIFLKFASFGGINQIFPPIFILKLVWTQIPKYLNGQAPSLQPKSSSYSEIISFVSLKHNNSLL
jgi:hypothetical protein